MTRLSNESVRMLRDLFAKHAENGATIFHQAHAEELLALAEEVIAMRSEKVRGYLGSTPDGGIDDADREPQHSDKLDCHYDGDINRCDKNCKQLGECKRRTTGVPSAVAPILVSEIIQRLRIMAIHPSEASSEELWKRNSPHVRLDEVEEVLRSYGVPSATALWISTNERLPEDETPVLIVWNGQTRIGEIRWDHPGHEETYVAFRYWDDPTDDGQAWDWREVTHWMPLPSAPTDSRRPTDG